MILDIIIIVFLLFGILVGVKNGFVKSLVSVLGSVAVFVLAYILKKPLGSFLASVCPFFDFEGLNALNIILYQLIAFILLLIIFGMIFRVLLYATTIFEKILNATIVLGIVSKILGGVVGFVRNYIIAFIILYILSFPFLSDLTFYKESKLKDNILTNTVILSKVGETTKAVTSEIDSLTKDENANQKIIELLLKYDLITEENITELTNQGKINS